MLIGTEGVYSYTFEHEKRDDCPVCGGSSLELSISKDATVEDLIDVLIERQDMYVDSLIIPMQPDTYWLLGVSAAKSRNRLSPLVRSTSTSRLLHS